MTFSGLQRVSVLTASECLTIIIEKVGSQIRIKTFAKIRLYMLAFLTKYVSLRSAFLTIGPIHQQKDFS